MKLGKALATGVAEERVAEERPLDQEEETRQPEEVSRTAPADPAREEVPAAR